jgi:hypothetical protein
VSNLAFLFRSGKNRVIRALTFKPAAVGGRILDNEPADLTILADGQILQLGKEASMSITTLPAGIRLDAWPGIAMNMPQPYAQEVDELRLELRRLMPNVMIQLEVLDQTRQLRDLLSRTAVSIPITFTTCEI